MNQEMHEKALKMSVEETRRVLKENGMPGPEKFYNLISIEHDIPLEVAEAMLQCCVVFAGQITDPSTSPVDRQLLKDGFLSMWLKMAGPLRIPQERMLRAVKATITAGGELCKSCDEAIDRAFGDNKNAPDDRKGTTDA